MYLFVFFMIISSLVSFGDFIYIQSFFDAPKKNLKQWIYTIVNRKKIKSSKIYISCERACNFDRRKTFSKNYKAITASLWLVYKFIANNLHLRLFSRFTKFQKRYPNSLDKISIQTWKLLVISSQNFSCELDTWRTYFLQIILCRFSGSTSYQVWKLQLLKCIHFTCSSWLDVSYINVITMVDFYILKGWR